MLLGGCVAAAGGETGPGPRAQAVAASTAPTPADPGLVEARGGPLSAADRDLLVKVRLAGLWELPVGRQAAQRAARARTRENLGQIARMHVDLDADVRSVAAKLRVPLPDEPNADQQAWIAEISGKQGLAYDRTAVMRLRMAHGKVFPLIAQVRASTQNTLIRDFAERSAKFVNTHMDMLEATGFADAAALPPPPEVTGPVPVPPDEDLPREPAAASLPTPDGLAVEDVPESSEEPAPTEWGPLSGADRDLLVKVRQAGLWEIPVGRQAAQRASRAKTRENLGEIARMHVDLDADVRSVAAKLRVPLPDLPSDVQQGWMAEISGQDGLAYDRTAVARLRMAHGKVFPAIAQVRASTQNTLIRDFAERSAKFVNAHMDMLEATGLVDAAALPPPPEVAAAKPAGSGQTSPDGVVPTEWGPLSPADRDLLVKVRLAGLWEIPVGRQAAQRAARARTRENLGQIARMHVELDADVRSVAAKLRVPLPDEPNADQRAWIAEISGKQGLAYDRTAVMRLRMAHGKVFPLIAQVRASTQNTLIRDFAERSAKFVNAHMDMLEATGLVGPNALPPPPDADDAPDPVPFGEPAPTEPPATALPRPTGP